ncbi:permease [Desulfopila sp. IMCC35008]|uniref:permease n=1 Tax=Desulfopila sp. IMCC35008 TaxID=2653858 RepID=UPI0013D82E7D|nr:permease [Desulfopila sp. IMCC35008]
MIKETANFFVYTMTELAVLFIGISFMVGVINEFLPKEKVQRLLSGKYGGGYLIGSILGGITPFCSCSTIPVMVGLLRAKAGFGPTMAFLFTSPLVNPIIIPLFFTLLGFEITFIYATVAIGMTIVISFCLERAGFARYVRQDVLFKNSEDAESSTTITPLATTACCENEVPMQPVQLHQVMQCCATTGPTSDTHFPPVLPVITPQPSRWMRIFSDALLQFRTLLPFVFLGVATGSFIHGFLPADLVAGIAGADNPLAVPLSAIVGIPLYLRAATMVPIAASLLAKGMSMGAIIALIIGGAGASLPEVAMLRGLFRLPLLAAFLASAMLMAISAGFLVNLTTV